MAPSGTQHCAVCGVRGQPLPSAHDRGLAGDGRIHRVPGGTVHRDPRDPADRLPARRLAGLIVPGAARHPCRRPSVERPDRLEIRPAPEPFRLASDVLIGGGFWLIAGGRRVLHEAGRGDRLATTGPYAHVRHPVYDGLLLIMIGFLLGWPTIATLVMFPVLIVYARLTRSQQREVARRHPTLAARLRRRGRTVTDRST